MPDLMPGYNLIRMLLGRMRGLPLSLRGANGSRECAPDDRLRDEAIQSLLFAWIASLRHNDG
jgi:hypothetical protein